MYGDILGYRKGLYFKVALILLVLSALVYITQGGMQPPNGGTWQGYLLGTLAALIVLYLSFLGVRKRQYSSSAGSVLGWTSAHVYLGLALLPIATLHSAGQLGWNVHTLAYALLWLVVLSGIQGLYLYTAYPFRMSRNLMSQTRDHWLAELATVNRESLEEAAGCDVEIADAVTSAVARTNTPDSLIAQLLGLDRSLLLLPGKAGDAAARPTLRNNTDQQPLIDFISNRIPRGIRREEPAKLQKLLSLCSRRQAVLRILRRDLKYRASLKAWLAIHIPMSVALLAALVVHIISVFIYW